MICRNARRIWKMFDYMMDRLLSLDDADFQRR